MKTLLIILFVLTGLKVLPQQTNRYEYVITGSKFANHNLSYLFTNGKSRLIVYTQEGNQYIDIIIDNELKAWRHGIITNNDIESREYPATSTSYKSIIFHKNWSYTIFSMEDHTTSDKITEELTLIVVNRPDKIIMTCSLLSSSNIVEEFSGYQIK